MSHRFVIQIVALLSIASACGGEGGDKPAADVADAADLIADETVEETSVGAFCAENPGESCEDNDPCTIGEGTCLGAGDAAICFYETAQRYECDKPPKSCYGAGICDGAGGCSYEMIAGWCLIHDECVMDGTKNPSDPCEACDSELNRGGWSPLSGSACTPEGNPCTTMGQCQEGFCVPIAGNQECAVDFDCVDYDDGDLCNGTFLCLQCKCQFDGESVVTCDSSSDTACLTTECLAETGQCVQQAAQDGSGCDDGDPCTSPDFCQNAECIPGEKAELVWGPIGSPDAAYLSSVEVVSGDTPAIIAVGTGGVFYRTTNLTEPFEASDIVAPGGVVGDWLVVVPGEPAAIMAIFDGNLIVSINGGLSYASKLVDCEALTSTASAPGTLFAACQSQIFKSVDKGATWNPAGNIPGGGGARVTALAAYNDQLLLAGTQGEDSAGRGYVYRSQNGGASWDNVDPPQRPDLAYVAPHGLHISTNSPDKAFLGYANAEPGPFEFGNTALFRSDDQGLAFTVLGMTALGQVYTPLSLDPMGQLLVGVDLVLHRGGNFGTGPWGPIKTPEPLVGVELHTITDAANHPTSNFSFLVPAANGLAVAEDLGANWKLYKAGMRAGVFAIVKTCGEVMFAVDHGSNGLYRSTNGGDIWLEIELPEEAGSPIIDDLTCDEGDGSRVLAFTLGGGVLSSSNSGQSFTYTDESNGPTLGTITGLAGDTTTPNRVYLTRLGMGTFVSEDGAFAQGKGFAATPVPDTFVSSILADPHDDNYLYVGTYASAEFGKPKVYRCDKGGTNCSVKLQSDVAPAPGMNVGFDLFANKGMAGRVYAAISGDGAAIYYSSDFGDSWQVFVHLPIQGTQGRGDILPDRDNPGSLFVAFREHSLLYYSQQEDEWKVLSDAPFGISTLAYAPGENGKLLAGSGLDSKLWASSDGGASWSILKDFTQTGYHVYRVVSDSDYLFAILHGKFKGQGKLFVQQGIQWKDTGIAEPLSDVMVQIPENEQVLATAAEGGVYVSDDGGSSFALQEGLDTAVNDLVVASNDFNRLYAAVTCGGLPSWYDEDEPFLGPDCGVMRSVDGGEFWVVVWNSSGNECTALVTIPENPEMLLAACPDHGVIVTTNGGSNWEKLSDISGLNADFTKKLKAVNSLAFSDGWLYLGTHDSGVLRAELSFEDWSFQNWDVQFSSGAGNLSTVSTVQLTADPANASRIVVHSTPGGLVRTENHGEDWRNASGAMVPDMSYISGEESTPGLLPFYVPSEPGGYELWVGAAGQGYYVSRDQGRHWIFGSMSLPALTKAHPVTLVYDDDYSGYAWFGAREGVFRTSDFGTTWQKLETGLASGIVEAMLGPANGQVYAAIAGGGLYRVPFDGGAWEKAHGLDLLDAPAPAWSGRNFATWHSVAPLPSSQQAFLVALDPYGMYMTQDGGLSFKQVGLELPMGRLTGLTTSPADEDTFFVGTSAGPYISTDGGDSFMVSGSGAGSMGQCFDFAFDAQNDQVVYALCAAGLPHGLPETGVEEAIEVPRKVYRSEDGGESWNKVATTYPASKAPVQFLMDPTEADVLYLVNAAGAVARSEDGGISFEPWGTGLPSPSTAGADRLYSAPGATSPMADRFLVGTDGFGFYTRTLAASCE